MQDKTTATSTKQPPPDAPHVTVAVTDLVRLANCPHCWQRPGRPCTVSGIPGDHLARWQRAERRGLIARDALAAVVADLEVIAAHVIIRAGAQ
jgi:hypothetical protein